MNAPNRLIVLDKCINGDIDRMDELTGAIYDEFSQLYNALHPFLYELTLEAVEYTRQKDFTSFVVKTKPGIPAKTQSKFIEKISGSRATFNIPITKEG